MVTGAHGMLGADLVRAIEATGDEVTALGRPQLDVRDAAAVRDAVAGHDVVVSCAAYTAVDHAEADEPTAFAVNAMGAAHLARAAAATGARMVQISTDYVFDGAATSPYGEDAPLAPRSAYGRTKAAGEWAARAEHEDVLVVRTAWLYGAHGRCFPRTIAEALDQREHLDVVDDQVGQPTWTVDVSDLVLRLVQATVPAGTYHATATGEVSWHGFAQAVAEEKGLDPVRVRSTTSEAFVRPAARPGYSVLGHDALTRRGIAPIGPWRSRFAQAASAVLAR